MGASYPLADLMAALKTECNWWHSTQLSEHDDMHSFSLNQVYFNEASLALPWTFSKLVRRRLQLQDSPDFDLFVWRNCPVQADPLNLRVENRNQIHAWLTN